MFALVAPAHDGVPTGGSRLQRASAARMGGDRRPGRARTRRGSVAAPIGGGTGSPAGHADPPSRGARRRARRGSLPARGGRRRVSGHPRGDPRAPAVAGGARADGRRAGPAGRLRRACLARCQRGRRDEQLGGPRPASAVPARAGGCGAARRRPGSGRARQHSAASARARRLHAGQEPRHPPSRAGAAGGPGVDGRVRGAPRVWRRGAGVGTSGGGLAGPRPGRDPGPARGSRAGAGVVSHGPARAGFAGRDVRARRHRGVRARHTGTGRSRNRSRGGAGR